MCMWKDYVFCYCWVACSINVRSGWLVGSVVLDVLIDFFKFGKFSVVISSNIFVPLSPLLLLSFYFCDYILCVFAFLPFSSFYCYVFKFTHLLFCFIMLIPVSVFFISDLYFSSQWDHIGSFLYLPYPDMINLSPFWTYKVYLNCFNVLVL